MTPAHERRIEELGRQIAQASETPWWRPRSFDDRLLAWVVGRPGLRTRLFRFVDVFPATHDAADVTHHLQQYLSGAPLPPGARTAVRHAGQVPAITARLARSQIRHLARRFIAAELSDEGSPDAVVERIGELWQSGSAATVDLLGEKTLTAAEADAYTRRVLRLIDALSREAPNWPASDTLDRDRWGAVPRVNISVKPTALSPRFDPLEGDEAVTDAFSRLERIIAAAREVGATVHLDVEHDEVHELTYQLLRRAGNAHPQAHLGVVIQAYRLDAADNLARLTDWAAATMREPLQIRLVKGAYWDQEQVAAATRGWPAPVHVNKEATDANFERCARFLVEHAGPVRPLVGTHNIRSIAATLAAAEQAGLSPSDVELQLLYGMAPALRPALVQLGYRTRVYAPVGDLETGMAYLVRRLLENTSNDSFVRRREVDRTALDELLRPPDEYADVTSAGVSSPGAAGAGVAGAGVASAVSASGGTASGDVAAPGEDAPTGSPPRVTADTPFSNEPPAELRRPGPRRLLLESVDFVGRGLGFDAPVLVGGKALSSPHPLLSVNPGRPEQVVCRAGRATAAHVDQALKRAVAAAPGWAARPAEDRARILVRTAVALRRDRFLLAALIAYEAGKPLPEADADVCEAIDFCEYYARRALVLAKGAPVLQAPGESNRYVYQPRGVGVVISPWNFPLAIPTGMVAAALVTGNAVLFKPAEQTPGVASRLVASFYRAGVPPDVLAYLPGLGDEAGAAAVADARTDFIAFVGSRDVGRSIIAEAARPKPGQRQLPRVIAELGGKNPIVIDEDADLDVAVPAVIASAFGYAGQKCSAASRLIVPRRRLDETVERLVGAVSLVPVGQATDLRTVVGPLIDEEAQARVMHYQQAAHDEGEVLIERDDAPDAGWFVAPQVVLVSDPSSPLVRDEIFGPLLCVQPAADFDEALALANDTEYALTAGLFSRSPTNIRRAAGVLRAGNVYVNRATTGALVGRQPFGGYGMSGVGSKAGGADYLLQFVDPRVITENTLRQGFVPDGTDPDEADDTESAAVQT